MSIFASKKVLEIFDKNSAAKNLNPKGKSYVVKWPKEKEGCHSHDSATPFSVHSQVADGGGKFNIFFKMQSET